MWKIRIVVFNHTSGYTPGFVLLVKDNTDYYYYHHHSPSSFTLFSKFMFLPELMAVLLNG
jgi:hypothetical protein